MRFDWVAYIQALLTAIASLFMGALMPTIAVFYGAGRMENRSSRIVFFWIPTILICSVGLSLWTFFVYVMTHHGPGQP